MLFDANWNRLLRRFPLFLFLLVSQAHAGLFDDDVARQKIVENQQEIQKLEALVQKLQGSLVDMASQIQSQSADIAALRGRIEELGNGLDTAQKRQKDFYVDLDTRLRRLEPQSSGGTPAAEPASAPAAVTAPVAASAPAAVSVPAAKPSGEAAEYEAAFDLFKIGNYSGAISGFQDFLKAHPSSSYAPSAQYWIGNAYFATRDFKSAISAQKIVISKYPESPKAPDALLNIASSQQELGKTKEARKTLKSIVSKYPSSDAAAKAKQRLNSLK
ncbi:MAG: tol-pal system protein YbgF [Burkholderiales bacterium]